MFSKHITPHRDSLAVLRDTLIHLEQYAESPTPAQIQLKEILAARIAQIESERETSPSLVALPHIAVNP